MRITTIVKAATCAASLFVVSGTMASAATVLDQTNDTGSNVSYSTSSTLTWQQQVVAGIAGTLQQIEVNFGFGSGTLEFFVNLGTGWQSDADDFVTTISGASGYTAIDVSGAGISLANGDAFVFGIRNGDGAGDFRGSSGNLYAAGGLFLNGSAFAVSDYDLNFRTTVNTTPAPVPLPAGLPLMLLGLGAFGAMRKAKKA